jgi:hypothetical protein
MIDKLVLTNPERLEGSELDVVDFVASKHPRATKINSDWIAVGKLFHQKH